MERAAITKYLDLGADGLLIPMVRDAEDARLAVEFAKYSPIGHRGVSISRAHSDYAPGDLRAYMANANVHTRIYVQIELSSALRDVDAIAAVPGLSALMVGPSDLAMDLQVFPSQTDPILLDAVSWRRCVGSRTWTQLGNHHSERGSDRAFPHRWDD